MQTETARACMRGIGLNAERTECIAGLLEKNRKREARQRLRSLRCELMDELHDCQKRVDQLDWLIRETEKELDD